MSRIEFKDEYDKVCDSKEAIKKFIKKAIEENKTIISFDDVEFKVDIFNFSEVIKDDVSNKSFTFNNSVFNSNVTFYNLSFNKISFNNTTFNYGANLESITADIIIYYPKELNSDVIFDDCEISFFKYKNQSRGDGFTRFYNIFFKIKADFRKSILDNVHFKNQTMKNIYLLDSKVDKTLFDNCEFENKINIYPYHQKYRFLFIVLFFTAYILFLKIIFPSINWVYIELLNYINREFYFPNIEILIKGVDSFFSFFGELITYPVLFSFIILLPFILNETHIIIIKAITKVINKIFKKQSLPRFTGYLSIADDKIEENKINRIKTIYEEISLNFANKKDFIRSIDFNYNYKYLDSFDFKKSNQSLLDNGVIIPLHHFINSFGTNWLKPIFWFFLTIFIFAFLTNSNEDYISTQSTPPFLLTAYNEQNSIITFDENNITKDLNKTAHFFLIAKTNYKDINKTIAYAYDNRFNFEFNEQYVPMLKNDFTIKLYYSFSNIVAPFTPDNKKWFTNRTDKAVKLSILETILLWFFFGAFVLAIKNRIRR